MKRALLMTIKRKVQKPQNSAAATRCEASRRDREARGRRVDGRGAKAVGTFPLIVGMLLTTTKLRGRYKMPQEWF